MHYIIITHRNRNTNLKWCLWSIANSEAITGITDYRVLVIDAKSDVEPDPPRSGGVFIDGRHGRLFNKSRLNNIGLELIDTGLSRCGQCRPYDVVTFLDADAIVGSHWLAAVQCLESSAITVLSYRVKLLPLADFAALEQYPDNARAIHSGWFLGFAKPDRFTTCGEFYNDTDTIYRGPDAPPPAGKHVIGNSQISMRRDTIGDLRYDDRLRGRGCEDQMFLREVLRRHGESYCGALMTEPHFAMLHVHDPQPMTEDDDWNNIAARKRNQDLYEES